MGCHLEEFPVHLALAKKLTVLNLNGNALTSIPRAIVCCLYLTFIFILKGYLSNLEKLNLQNNNIVSISPAIDHLRRLEDLNTSGNPRLSTLPDEVKNLHWLQFVDISDCHFEIFPEGSLPLSLCIYVVFYSQIDFPTSASRIKCCQ